MACLSLGCIVTQAKGHAFDGRLRATRPWLHRNASTAAALLRLARCGVSTTSRFNAATENVVHGLIERLTATLQPAGEPTNGC